MKPTKKDVKKVTKKKETKEPIKKDRLKELEDLVVSIDKRIVTLEDKMNSMDSIFTRIKTRLGV